MNISDTFYVALCMTVLILGVVYWFWTQNQYIQRKVNLLENIVYEMKTSMSSSGEAPDLSEIAPSEMAPRVAYAAAPSSVLGEDEDILHEELVAEMEPIEEESVEDAIADFAIDNAMPLLSEEEGTSLASLASLDDDLQPGGVGSGIREVTMPEAKGSVLDSMTLPELKRLAEQRGISAASKMRKQALIDAIRAAPVNNPFTSTEATLELS